MYDIAKEMKDIKPKYLDNDMLIYFDDRKLIFSPEPGFTVIKTIDFKGADANLIKFGAIDDINKSITDIGDEYRQIYNLDMPTRFISLNLTKEVTSVFNAISSCGSSIVSGSSIECSGQSLIVSGYSIDCVAAFVQGNYNACGINIEISGKFNLMYYLYVLDKIYGTKEGLSIQVYKSGRTSWIKCNDIMLVIDEKALALKYSGIISVFDRDALLAETKHDKKVLAEVYGTRFKHLAKCLSDNIHVMKLGKCTVFGSGNTFVMLGDKK